jgi:phosphomevalonate kinase
VNTVVRSAPGKLVLVGEYAVLEGAPALALAVDRRATVRLSARHDDRAFITAPQLESGVVEARLDEKARLQWRCDAAVAARLGLVTQIHAELQADGMLADLRGFDLSIDTAGFVHQGHKLGLGSSAAVTVSLSAAFCAAAGDRIDVGASASSWAPLLARHARWQQGQGSGIDIATSLVGGLIVFQRGDGSQLPTVESRPWPRAGLHCQFLWSGQSMSTAGQLQRLRQWKLAEPARHAACFSRLSECAEVAVDALEQGASAFVAAVDAYACALQKLTEASGLAIFTPAQSALAQEARRLGAAFKPCGAGGDMGVLLTDSAEALIQLRGSIMASGMQALELHVDACGLR